MPVLGVDVALGVHAGAESGFAEQLDAAPFEHPGANPRQHVLAALTLDHDALDAGPVQQERQQRTGRAGADDRDLGACGRRSSSRQYDNRVGWC